MGKPHDPRRSSLMRNKGDTGVGTAARATLGLLVTKSRLNCQQPRSNTRAPRAVSHSPRRLMDVARPLRTRRFVTTAGDDRNRQASGRKGAARGRTRQPRVGGARVPVLHTRPQDTAFGQEWAAPPARSVSTWAQTSERGAPPPRAF